MMKGHKVKRLFLLAICLFCSATAFAQTPETTKTPDAPAAAASKPAPVTLASSTAIKMPAEDSAGLKNLQTQADKLLSDSAAVINAYKEYETQLARIRAAATVLITRAGMKAKLSVEQLDTMVLTLDDKGNYEWRKAPETPTNQKAPPKK